MNLYGEIWFSVSAWNSPNDKKRKEKYNQIGKREKTYFASAQKIKTDKVDFTLDKEYWDSEGRYL